jgi:ankyrin repeat protein
MKFLNLLLLIGCSPIITNAQSSAAAGPSTEFDVKSRASSATVVQRDIHLGDIHILARASVEKFQLTARGTLGNDPQIGTQLLHALLCCAEVNRGQSDDVRSKFDHLMELSVDVNGIHTLFGTPLHHAARLTDHDDSAYFTEYLLKRGALPKKELGPEHMSDNRSAHQIAAANNHERTCELLSNYGSHQSPQAPTQKNEDSCTIM